jgi:beta-1,2-mannobiose phosphorylase / 1,2-beta-oligomannan phosphorylase
MLNRLLVICFLTIFLAGKGFSQKEPATKHPEMMFGDTVRLGVPFSKDPHVIRFGGQYLMYYSVPSYTDRQGKKHGWWVGIAESKDLNHWKRIGEVNVDRSATYEEKGMAAPCALVIGKKVHLFYQIYGNDRKDAICHAWSTDGINFIRDKTNPIFHPEENWTCGRAIDAEVIKFHGNYFLYYATRDPGYKIQMQGVAVAPGNTDFKRQDWKNLSLTGPMLKPELPWEKDCIEGASVINIKGTLYMFYAGAYNNAPQQIGVAKSNDGIKWTRLSDYPFLANGKTDEWNSSESGHPHIFKDNTGKTFLFFQGNNDKGKTWYLSNLEVKWNNSGPYIEKK